MYSISCFDVTFTIFSSKNVLAENVLRFLVLLFLLEYRVCFWGNAHFKPISSTRLSRHPVTKEDLCLCIAPANIPGGSQSICDLMIFRALLRQCIDIRSDVKNSPEQLTCSIPTQVGWYWNHSSLAHTSKTPPVLSSVSVHTRGFPWRLLT